VKVTGVPAHIVLAEAETETLTGRFGLTAIVIVFDVAGLFEVQTVLDDVKTHFTASPLIGVYVKIDEFVPLLTEFTFHW